MPIAFRFLRAVLVCASSIFASTAYAEDGQISSVPVDLQPWVEWVRAANPEWRCAKSSGQFVCVWPGAAEISLRPKGAELSLRVDVLKESWLDLPASEVLLPANITVTSSAGSKLDAPVAHSPGSAQVKLPEGSFIVQARYTWDKLPPELPIPSNYGYLNVRFLDGLPFQHTKRTDSGIFFEAVDESPSTQSAAISVFRRLSDGSPLRLETKIRLQISGRARPIDLGQVLPASFTPVEINSPLPTFLGADGKLALQAVSGDFEVSIQAITQQPLGSVSPAAGTSIWPQEEIWAWVPQPEFRSVEISGASPVQAETTGLPPEWNGAAAYILQRGQSLTLKELRRGEQSAPANNLQLFRELWPSFDGSGFTVRDRFKGNFTQGERLNALPETKLGRATQNGKQLLITSDAANNMSGVELRDTALNVEAVSTISGTSSLSAVGWDTSVNALSLALHLPPLWRLMFVSGGSAPTSWLESWSLLHLFLGIVMVVVARLLLGGTIACLLGAALFLNHGEFMAPRMLFVHLLLLVAWRSIIEEKESFWGQLCNNVLVVTLIAWTLQGLAFLKLQFTQALFPQLEAGTRYRTFLQHILTALEDHLLAWPLLLLLLVAAAVAIRYLKQAKNTLGFFGRLFVVGLVASLVLPLTGSVLAGISWLGGSSNYAARYETAVEMPEFQDKVGSAESEDYLNYESAQDSSMPGAAAGNVLRKMLPRSKQLAVPANENTFTYQDKALASGPALPSWSWRQHRVQVSSPALPEHQLKVVLLSPFVNRVFSLLRVLIMIALLLAVPRRLGYRAKLPSPASAALVLGLLVFPSTGWAEFPRESLLKELRGRIVERQCQRERCASIERMSISLSEDKFRLEIEANSEGKAALTLPGPIEVFPPNLVQLNGKDSNALRRLDSGLLELQTPAGRSSVVVEGRLGHADAFSLQFMDRPLSLSVNAPLWLTEGLLPSGVVSESLRFTRREKPSDSAVSEHEKQASSTLPWWLIVERQLRLHDQLRIVTTVKRLGSLREPYHARIPLLPGEQVTSDQVSIEAEQALIHFPTGVESVQYQSSMPFQTSLTLRASAVPRLSEEWQVQCSSILACSYKGITPTSSSRGASRMLVWNPFPSEEVILEAKQLSSLPGEHLTVDSLSHDARWGSGVLQGTLNATLRLTEQAPFEVTLPENSQLVSAQLNQANAAYTSEGNKIALLLSPGAQAVQLSYRLPFNPQLKETAPAISINSSGHNVTLRVLPSPDRWLLWTSADGWGPSVLFWSKLLVVVGLCVALHFAGLLGGSRIGAALLGIGLASLPMVWIGVPLLWLTLIHRGDLYAKFSKDLHPRARVGILVAISVLGTNFLYQVVKTGLVLTPPMLVVGNQSSSSKLQWLFDQTGPLLPQPWVLSLPLWAWRAFALVWATWLVIAFIGWLKSSAQAIKRSA